MLECKAYVHRINHLYGIKSCPKCNILALSHRQTGRSANPSLMVILKNTEKHSSKLSNKQPPPYPNKTKQKNPPTKSTMKYTPFFLLRFESWLPFVEREEEKDGERKLTNIFGPCYSVWCSAFPVWKIEYLLLLYISHLCQKIFIAYFQLWSFHSPFLQVSIIDKIAQNIGI